jgi:hypothetical protein
MLSFCEFVCICCLGNHLGAPVPHVLFWGGPGSRVKYTRSRACHLQRAKEPGKVRCPWTCHTGGFGPGPVPLGPVAALRCGGLSTQQEPGSSPILSVCPSAPSPNPRQNGQQGRSIFFPPTASLWCSVREPTHRHSGVWYLQEQRLSI